MEDYIDFPCSPAWLDYYHANGLTPRKSGEKDISEIRILSEILREIKENQAKLEKTMSEWINLQLNYQRAQTREVRKDINVKPFHQSTKKQFTKNKGVDLDNASTLQETK